VCWSERHTKWALGLGVPRMVVLSYLFRQCDYNTGDDSDALLRHWNSLGRLSPAASQ
jgi:hypothetical protein